MLLFFDLAGGVRGEFQGLSYPLHRRHPLVGHFLDSLSKGLNYEAHFLKSEYGTRSNHILVASYDRILTFAYRHTYVIFFDCSVLEPTGMRPISLLYYLTHRLQNIPVT